MDGVVTLKELLLDSKDGEWGKGEEFDNYELMKVIRGTDFDDVRVGILSGVPERYIPQKIADRKALCPGDILLETAGGSKDRPTGRTVYISHNLICRSEYRLTCSSFSRFLRVNRDKAEPKYIYWLLQYMYSSGLMRPYNTQHTGVARFQYTVFSKREQFNLPSICNQRKIATILSAYDKLIVNNTRRIKILEEMAQLIYREWFVKFKFPGHEKVRMVESELGLIPEGWEVKRLGDILSTIESGSRPRGGIKLEDKDVPSIGAENIRGLGQYDYAKDKFVTRAFFDNMKRGIIKSGDVLLYKDGAQLGRKSMFRDGFPHEECCVNEHVFILRTNGECSQAYLFFWLDQEEMTQRLINLNTNAAQPGINQEGVKSLPVLIPNQSVHDLFNEKCEPILAQLFNLAKKNRLLRRTRDLLLPKLISGELDVEDLDIAVGGD